MIVNEMLTLLRKRIIDEHKIEYQDSELISYINDAINLVNNSCIANRDPIMVKEIFINNTIFVPTDFVRWAGQYPVYIIDEKIKLLNPKDSLTCSYYATKPNVVNNSDIIPFNDAYCSLILQLAAIYALNRNQFDISQDERLMNVLAQALSLSKNGGTR